MRVECARDIFTDPCPTRRHIQAVDRLLETFDEERHDWVLDFDDLDDVAAYLSKHHPTLAQAYLSMAEKAAQSKAWVGTTQAGSVVLVPKAELAEYAADLYRKAIIAVENIPGDKYFLVAVAHAFDHQRIRKALEEKWVEFRHGGGSGQLPAVAEEEAGHFQRRIRVVAVFDSDSLAPDHEGPNREKARKLHDKQIPAYVLLRREAENYAPDRVLETVGHKRRAAKRVALMARLHPHQRGHLDIKKGLPRQIAPEQQAIYAALDEDLREGLSGGFGDGVLKRMHEMREQLCEADFEAMDADAAADLRTLLTLIDSLI